MLTNKRFVITTTILSRVDNATPADVTWYRGEDHAQALAALVSAAALVGDDEKSDLPESMKFDIKAVRLDIYDIEPECSGTGKSRADGYNSVPYCGTNPGGCLLHYPNGVSGQVSGNSASTSSPAPLVYPALGEDAAAWRPLITIDYSSNPRYQGTVYRLRGMESDKMSEVWESSDDYGTLARIIEDNLED